MPPSWGRPPGGATGVGRYYEGVAADDVYRFQEPDSDDEKNGVPLDQASTGKLLNPDDLYFNDMDIRAWERRATALGVAPHAPDYDFQEEEEGYFDDAGEPISAAEYQDILFERVLDKIRLARAAGNPDVQLSSEEIEAYQSKLHGERSPAVRSQARRSPSNPVPHDTASVASGHSANHTSSKSKSKKKERTSLFSSKPKKEKPSSRKRAPSNVSSAGSPSAPGFVIPGPDGHPIYAPINPYQGNMARDPIPTHQQTSRPPSGAYYGSNEPLRSGASNQFLRDVPGAFPSAWGMPSHGYYYEGYPSQSRVVSTEHQQEPKDPTPPPEPPKLVPFPVEPYQYQSFSPTDSSSSQASPQLQYIRRPSAPPSEVSYTAMPRRVPVPVQRTIPTTTDHVGFSDPITATAQPSDAQSVVEVTPQPVAVAAGAAVGNGKDGERRRKAGKKKKV